LLVGLRLPQCAHSSESFAAFFMWFWAIWCVWRGLGPDFVAPSFFCDSMSFGGPLHPLGDEGLCSIIRSKIKDQSSSCCDAARG